MANIAAILLLPFIGISVIMTIKYYSLQSKNFPVTESYNEILSSVDAITQVTLPDGSVVWLNRRSSLRYPAVFAENQRHVELKGEGYFEVNEDPQKPFIISTDKIQVIARGTAFNIMAYPEEDNIETTLISGNVELRKSFSEGKSEILCFMNPSDLTVYNRNNGAITVKPIQDDRYFSWKYGKLVFTAEPLTEVIKKLNRWFNVDIEITDQKLKDLTLTATFMNETLPQVMDLISQVSPISYTITKREISADGTYTKRKVKLYSQDNLIR
jgi:ferric-dicitrate binding protein FerR (iron transport regulator)